LKGWLLLLDVGAKLMTGISKCVQEFLQGDGGNGQASGVLSAPGVKGGFA